MRALGAFSELKEGTWMQVRKLQVVKRMKSTHIEPPTQQGNMNQGRHLGDKVNPSICQSVCLLTYLSVTYPWKTMTLRLYF